VEKDEFGKRSDEIIPKKRAEVIWIIIRSPKEAYYASLRA
jgi:hypothetical protein